MEDAVKSGHDIVFDELAFLEKIQEEFDRFFKDESEKREAFFKSQREKMYGVLLRLEKTLPESYFESEPKEEEKPIESMIEVIDSIKETAKPDPSPEEDIDTEIDAIPEKDRADWRKILDYTHAILSREARPMVIGELNMIIQSRGFITGNNQTLMARMRHDGGFQSFPGRGWMIKTKTRK